MNRFIAIRGVSTPRGAGIVTGCQRSRALSVANPLLARQKLRFARLSANANTDRRRLRIASSAVQGSALLFAFQGVFAPTDANAMRRRQERNALLSLHLKRGAPIGGWPMQFKRGGWSGQACANNAGHLVKQRARTSIMKGRLMCGGFADPATYCGMRRSQRAEGCLATCKDAARRSAKHEATGRAFSDMVDDGDRARAA